MQALKFNYYDEFACTGPQCEDSCCKHWNIFLTKREYLDYKKLECSHELKSIMDSAFKRNKSNNELQYAVMELKEDGSCPFLGEDRLCMLQKEKGESALTVVCSVFPRNWAKIGQDAIAFTLTPTCCHTVELLMKHPEGLILTEEEYDGKNKWINQNKFSATGLDRDSKMLPYIWTIKTAQLDILQNRDFTIAERLLILGYYTKKACEYLESSPHRLAQLGAMMLDKELTAKIADSLKVSQSDTQISAKSADILFKLTEYMHSKYPEMYTVRLLDTIADSVELKYELDDNGEYTVRYSNNAYAKNRDICRKIEVERPYITENLLVTLAFGSFSKDSEELWADYFSLVVLYNFLKTGVAAFLHGSCNDKELAMAITNIVKILFNAGLAKQVIMRDFMFRGENSLPYTAFLVS